MAGLTATGFEKLLLAQIKEEIEASLRASLGASINTIAPSTFSQIIGIYAEREALLWELAEEVYNSQYPDTADGVPLDNVVSINGITRLGATKSTQDGQILFGTIGTIVPAGTIFSVLGNPLARFLTDAPSAALIAGTDEVQTLTFGLVPDAGSFKFMYKDQLTASITFAAAAIDVQNALNALSGLSGVTVTGSFTLGFVITFAGADGKQNQPMLTVTNNTLLQGVNTVSTTVVQTTPGVPQATVTLTAESTGPTQALAGTLTVIETPVVGLTSTLNMEDANRGRAVETDNELRIRRENSIEIAGVATPDAIRAKLLEIEGVTTAIVFENTAFIEIDGRPPKSYEALVVGGLDQDITQKIWETKPAGILPFGNQTGTAVDSQGQDQIVQWSRANEVPIYVIVERQVNFLYPPDGDDRIEQAILDFGAALTIGEDVIVMPQLICAIADIPGIVDVVIKVGIAPAPTLSDNIPIDNDELATFDSANISVVPL